MNKQEFDETNRRIRDFFDGLADRWDSTTCPQHPERLSAIINGLDISKQARILDVGTGSGILLPFLAPSGAGERFVTAIDLAFRMLKYAAIRNGQANGSTACLQADAMTLPFQSGSFDWVICNSVFPHFLDQDACVRELSRVLTPGGSFVVCHSQSREAINTFHRSHGGLIGGHELPEEPEMRSMLSTANLETLRYENEEDHYILVARKTL